MTVPTTPKSALEAFKEELEALYDDPIECDFSVHTVKQLLAAIPVAKLEHQAVELLEALQKGSIKTGSYSRSIVLVCDAESGESIIDKLLTKIKALK